MKRFLLVHYSEIGLKKGNAPYFIDKLNKHIKIKLEQRFRENFKVKHTLGRFLIELPLNFVEADYSAVLLKIFGIKNFKFVYGGSIDVQKVGSQIWDNLPKDLLDTVLTFRVEVKRSMDLPFKSIEAEREIGAILLGNGIDKKVQLKGADLVIDVEFFNDFGYFSYKKYEGAGGLSANSQGKLICPISSGIDSPVAAFRMMRRGARVIFAHFHGRPHTDDAELTQVKEIVSILGEYQFDTKLYLLPLGKVQKDIATNLDVPAKIRTVLYRRMMLRISERISRKEEARGIITGDNFGQVASQTPENMFVIHEASTIPLFQPLIGYDKNEIIALSEQIGAFEISKLPCKDSCSMFMPKHPELKANLRDVIEIEKLLPISEWVEAVFNDAEIIQY